MQTIFTLASGRSGTHFLYELIRRNAINCVARHETYGWNPSMFGRPIDDHTSGRQERTRQLLARKQRIVTGYKEGNYVETSHAFLKSWYDLAPEYFPKSKFVHLIRDPLHVAKSEAYREAVIKRFRVPFCHYTGGDGQRYFLWSLNGREPIFQHFAEEQLTRFQWYVVQWIEIENRAIRFLDDFNKHAGCFTLHSPRELNESEKVKSLFNFLGLQTRDAEIHFEGRRNRNWRPTVITDEDRREFAEVIQAMPERYLSIFRSEPFASLPWAKSLA